MNTALKNRSLLALDELSASDVHCLLDMAGELKRQQRAGTEQPQLRDKNIALLSDTLPARAPGAFETAARHQGAHMAYVGADDAQSLADRHGMRDTARVFGRLYDAIEYRGSDLRIVSELAAHAGVPVWHDMAQPQHPTQALADCMTMQESCPGRTLALMRVACLGDARRPNAEALLHTAALLGMDLRVGAPPALWPAQARIDDARAQAAKSGAKLRFTASADEAVRGVDFICSDHWGAPEDLDAAWAERIAQLTPYRVSAALLAASGNPAVKFLHGLPSPQALAARKDSALFRRFGVDALEVTDEVLASAASAVAAQDGNRLHAIKALLVATLA